MKSTVVFVFVFVFVFGSFSFRQSSICHRHWSESLSGLPESLSAPTDLFARPLRSLRVSVTDRCNLRCQYCMPEEEYVWLPREDILTFEEIERLVRVFVSLGVDRVRLTGGEPLLRRDVAALVDSLSRVAGLADLALTTNGVQLADHAERLRRAGLHRITISLDTLDRSPLSATRAPRCARLGAERHRRRRSPLSRRQDRLGARERRE